MVSQPISFYKLLFQLKRNDQFNGAASLVSELSTKQHPSVFSLLSWKYAPTNSYSFFNTIFLHFINIQQKEELIIWSNCKTFFVYLFFVPEGNVISDFCWKSFLPICTKHHLSGKKSCRTPEGGEMLLFFSYRKSHKIANLLQAILC